MRDALVLLRCVIYSEPYAVPVGRDNERGGPVTTVVIPIHHTGMTMAIKQRPTSFLLVTALTASPSTLWKA